MYIPRLKHAAASLSSLSMLSGSSSMALAGLSFVLLRKYPRPECGRSLWWKRTRLYPHEARVSAMRSISASLSGNAPAYVSVVPQNLAGVPSSNASLPSGCTCTQPCLPAGASSSQARASATEPSAMRGYPACGQGIRFAESGNASGGGRATTCPSGIAASRTISEENSRARKQKKNRRFFILHNLLNNDDCAWRMDS